jgi:hypothetical protein
MSANLPLARYTDQGGRAHLVVLRGRLVLDLAAGDAPRVVAELDDDEGPVQARALLHGDGGYLERARVAEGPLCRALRPEDLRSGREPGIPAVAGESKISVMDSGEPPELAA